MSALKGVVTAQAIVLLVYGFPYPLVLNGIVTGAFAVALFATRRRA